MNTSGEVCRSRPSGRDERFHFIVGVRGCRQSTAVDDLSIAAAAFHRSNYAVCVCNVPGLHNEAHELKVLLDALDANGDRVAGFNFPVRQDDPHWYR